jgi:serine/threonine protein kinase
MEQSFNNETLNDFGDKSPIGGDNINIEVEQNMLIQPPVSNTQYEAMTIVEIMKKFNFQIFFKEEIQPNFSQVYVHNKYHKFYLAKNNTLGPLSIIVLNDVSNKKSVFGKLLEKLSNINDINCKNILKMKGIVNIDDKQIYLVFDTVLTSYRNKFKAKLIDISVKYITIFYLCEIVQQCHSRQIGLEVIRPSNLLYNNIDELRYLIPFRKI